MEKTGQLIKQARQNAGLTQPELAEKCGWGQSRISNYERGEREPGIDDLRLISKALGVDIYDLIANKSATKEPANIANAELHGGFEVWDSKTPLHTDEVAIPFYMEVELSAGAGSAVQREVGGPSLRFAKSTLRKSNVQPENAACVRVIGNSMDPVLPDGSTVGIDTGSTQIKDGAMYAIDHDGMLRVKLLYRLPGGGIRIKSFNNDEYPDEIYSSDDVAGIKIIGRVFWSSVLW